MTEKLFKIVLFVLSLMSVFLLGFVILYIVMEALPVFKEVSIRDFLFSSNWNPTGVVGNKSFGIFNFLAASVLVSVFAMLISVWLSIGCAIYLAFIAKSNIRSLLYAGIDLLAGIPSVIYGFIGASVIVRNFAKFVIGTGHMVLSAAILLSIMLLPYMISSFTETFIKVKDKYLDSAKALGVSRWYTIISLIIPVSAKFLIGSMVLAIGRAMGETMAVMMLMGNANLFPRLFGKAESIASLIALEMGAAVGGSMHFHALYASALVLMIALLFINMFIYFIRGKMMKDEFL
jgi:phosphate ABC transporter, permease protein pstC